jgi:hypothetical protein
MTRPGHAPAPATVGFCLLRDPFMVDRSVSFGGMTRGAAPTILIDACLSCSYIIGRKRVDDSGRPPWR